MISPTLGRTSCPKCWGLASNSVEEEAFVLKSSGSCLDGEVGAIWISFGHNIAASLVDTRGDHIII